MGQELECRLRLGRRVLTGRAYLETDHLLFRGEERIKIPLKDAKVTASNGILQLDYEGGPASLELGAAAAKWADKILNPPTLATKLGIKPGLVARAIGDFDPAFLAGLELQARGKVDLVFLLAPDRKYLAKIPKLAAALQPAGALWIVYPKGKTDIREIEVIQAGRAAGLKDVKVASFSATHTALKFMIPIDQR